MGIRFHCPNGHRLNVKSFLAGKVGICPECGVKMRIPHANEVLSDPARAAEAEPNKLGVSLESERHDGSETRKAEVGSRASVAELPTAEANTTSTPAVAGTKSETAWYVRPASGGQYGPANTKTFRQWVREGRVSDDTLVWRDGWKNWQSAEDVMEFKLAVHGDTPPPTAESIVVQAETSQDTSPVQRYHSRKSQQAKRNVSTIVILAVVALLLLLALLYVIISQW